MGHEFKAYACSNVYEVGGLWPPRVLSTEEELDTDVFERTGVITRAKDLAIPVKQARRGTAVSREVVELIKEKRALRRLKNRLLANNHHPRTQDVDSLIKQYKVKLISLATQVKQAIDHHKNARENDYRKIKAATRSGSCSSRKTDNLILIRNHSCTESSHENFAEEAVQLPELQKILRMTKVRAPGTDGVKQRNEKPPTSPSYSLMLH